MRWQPLLAEIRALKLTLARLEPRAGMPVQPPAGAPARAIEAVERRLGRPLPPSYRELLAQHDGVPGLYQGASLLGVRPLTRGTYVDLARLSIDLGRPAPESPRPPAAVTRASSLVADIDLIPFGIDATGETIFAWELDQEARADGELPIVVWMNEIGERVPSFPAFLELVLEMLGADVAERQRPSARVARPRASMPEIRSFQAA